MNSDEHFTLERRHSKKNWKQLFVKKTEKLSNERAERISMFLDGFYKSVQNRIVTVRLVKRIRERIRNHQLDPITNINSNISSELNKFSSKVHDPQVVCLICNMPCLTEAIACCTCCNLVHYICMCIFREEQFKNESDSEIYNAYDYKLNALTGKVEFSCPQCLETVYSDYMHVKKQEKSRAIASKETMMKTLIASCNSPKLVCRVFLNFVFYRDCLPLETQD